MKFYIGEKVFIIDGGGGAWGANRMGGRIIPKQESGHGWGRGGSIYIKVNEHEHRPFPPQVWGLAPNYKIQRILVGYDHKNNKLSMTLGDIKTGKGVNYIK